MKEKMTTGKICCFISVAMIFGAYIVQKVLNICLEHTRELAIIEAIVFSALTLVVYILVSRSKEPFYGILTAVFGIRMMPPEISFIELAGAEVDLVYYLVQKFAFVIFAFAIVSLYQEQKRPRMIKPIPILALILVVPFFNEISAKVSDFILAQTNGNMLLSYFSQFTFYTVSLIALLFIGTRCSKVSARLIADFQIGALLLNAGRRLCAIIIISSYGAHISLSYYCWLAIYAFFILAFYVLRKRRKTAIV